MIAQKQEFSLLLLLTNILEEITRYFLISRNCAKHKKKLLGASNQSVITSSAFKYDDTSTL